MKRSIFSVICAISVAVCMMFCGFRIGFVFADHEVFNGFCYLVWFVFIVNSLIMLFKLRSCIKNDKPVGKVSFWIHTALTLLSIICVVAFLKIGGADEFMNFISTSAETLPYLGGFYFAVFFVFLFPLCGKLFQRITAAVVSIAIVLSAVLYLLPVGGFAFESSPAVFNNGSCYMVSFATNRNSLGYVQYEYNGKTVTHWDRFTGRKEAQRVHSVEIPYEELDNNGYTVGAVRVYEDIAYGGHTGKTITQSVEKFTPCVDDNFEMLCITDNHACKIDWTKLRGDYGICVFLGDFANAVYTQNDMIDNLLVPAATVSEGAKPSIYVRGNHENRGKLIKSVLDSIGYTDFYYRINIGKYVFTVLDTGEDHEDDYYEYAGFQNCEDYYTEQERWISSLPLSEGYQIVLAHSPNLFLRAEDINMKAATSLKKLGVGLIIGGDVHTTEFVTADKSTTGIPYYVCGAKSSEKSLVYTVMSFNNGKIGAKSYDWDGKVVNEAEVVLESVTL